MVLENEFEFRNRTWQNPYKTYPYRTEQDLFGPCRDCTGPLMYPYWTHTNLYWTRTNPILYYILLLYMNTCHTVTNCVCTGPVPYRPVPYHRGTIMYQPVPYRPAPYCTWLVQTKGGLHRDANGPERAVPNSYRTRPTWPVLTLSVPYRPVGIELCSYRTVPPILSENLV